MAGERQSDLILLGGLWVSKSKGGTNYLSGRLGVGGKLLMFKNAKKKKDSDPDYYIYLGKYEQSDKGGSDDEVPF